MNTAVEALAAARQARDTRIEVRALLRVAETQMRLREAQAGLAAAQEAVRTASEHGLAYEEGRAWWCTSSLRSQMGQAKAADTAARKALGLARQCGDLVGAGNALNMLTFNEADIAKNLRLLREAQAAFIAAGHTERQAMIEHNLGVQYGTLGLFRRAVRQYTRAHDAYRKAGASGGPTALSLRLRGFAQHALGNDAEAKADLSRAYDLFKISGSANLGVHRASTEGCIAMWDGAADRALLHARESQRLSEGSDDIATVIGAHLFVCECALANGQAAEALAASTRAADLHRARGLTDLQGVNVPGLWWWHRQALVANGKPAEAKRALALAYRFGVAAIAKVTDEGLRRNFLDKDPEGRAMVLAYTAARSPSDRRRPPHLAGDSSLSEPFERLVDTGLRMNELRSRDALLDFLLDEATELSGAERVLVVQDVDGKREAIRSLVPRGEDAKAALTAALPWIDAAARAHSAMLAHTPDGKPQLSQRSIIVAPLIVRHETIAYLYCDIDGPFGRFHDADRNLLAMLASQAAIAIDNAQWSEGLEEKVAQRTAKLSQANALVEQRASELAIINSIQQGMSASLDFQAIVDLVGDKLREVMNIEDIGIRWYDHETRTAHFLYEFEHGKRITVPSVTASPERWHQVVSQRSTIFRNTRAEVAAAGILPGTECAMSTMSVRITSRDRVVGVVIVESFEREHAFGENEARLLETIASSMGVALENARLFDETQRLLKETEQRNSELAVINAVQQALAGELDIQGVYEAVGERLREVFPRSMEGIRVVDRASGQMLYPYGVHEGKRVYPAPVAVDRARLQRRGHPHRPHAAGQ